MSFSSRVTKRMDALVTRAKLAIFHTTQTVVPGNIDEKGALAAALTNELFGEEPKQEHLDAFGYDSIVSSAQALLGRDPETRELYIQSLRVVNVIRINHGQEMVCMELLTKYGKSFPDTPSPDDFERLVSAYEKKHDVEHRLIPSNYSEVVDREIEALRQENPWYLWPSRILFWVVVGLFIYWLVS